MHSSAREWFTVLDGQAHAGANPNTAGLSVTVDQLLISASGIACTNHASISQVRSVSVDVLQSRAELEAQSAG